MCVEKFIKKTNYIVFLIIYTKFAKWLVITISVNS